MQKFINYSLIDSHDLTPSLLLKSRERKKLLDTSGKTGTKGPRIRV